jgi:hypothetical protein
MAVTIDLVMDEDTGPSIVRVPDDATSDNRAEYMTWARKYFKVRFSVSYLMDEQGSNCGPEQILFDEAPDYERAIYAGKDARHLWYALRDWRGDDPEGYFGDLGAWAERRMKELDVDSIPSAY